MPNLLKKVAPQLLLQWLLLGFLLLSTFILLPLGTNQIETSKLLSLFFVTALSLWLLAAHLLKQPKFQLSTHPLQIATVCFGLTTLISIVFASSHPIGQITGFGGSLLGFISVILIGGWVLDKKSEPALSLVATLTTMGAIATLLVVLETIGLRPSSLYSFLLGLPLGQDIGFNPVGSLFIVTQLCFIAVITALYTAQRVKPYKNLFLTGAVINIIGFALAGWLCLPGKPANPVILPWTASWSITLDALRNPRTALIGLGPDNFNNAYTQFKPDWMNTTLWWNVEFTQASSLPFTIITTQGIISFLVWSYLSFRFFKERKKLYTLSPIATVTAATTLILVWFVPPTTFILSILATSLAFLIAETKNAYSRLEAEQTGLTITQPSLWQKIKDRLTFLQQPPTTVKFSTALTICLLGLVVMITTFQLIRAEFNQFQASQQSIKGSYVELYELQQTAIAINPYNDAARRNYALTNLAIASAISNKADLTDEDMQKVATLVQQSIREGKAAVLLQPQRAQNWEVLGDIYTNFIGSIDGTDTLALEAYQQALYYSPANPNLFVKLGGIYYRQAKYTEAILAFEQAAITKPDLANAYYNAANAFREMNDLTGAENAYKQTLLILEQAGGSTSEQYLKTNLELEDVQKRTATTSAQLEVGN